MLRQRLLAISYEKEDKVLYQRFLHHWSRKSLDEVLCATFLPLAFDKKGEEDTRNAVHHRLDLLVSTQGCLYVLPTYRELYHKVDEMWRNVPHRGLVLTGQPGIGKSFSLLFLLLCFITNGNRRPVALHIGGKTVRFKDGHVSTYKEGTALPSTMIPTCLLVDGHPNIGLQLNSLVSNRCFPVLACSPSPQHYEKMLVKQRSAPIWGLPVWTKHHLKMALPLQAVYDKVVNQLAESYEQGQLVLKGPWNESIDYMCSAAWELAYLQRAPTSRAKCPPTQRARALLDYLVDHYVDKYGPVPRVIYDCIFSGNALYSGEFTSSLRQKMDLQQLIKALDSISSKGPLSIGSISHTVFIIDTSAKHCSSGHDEFWLRSPTPWVSERLIKQLEQLGHEESKEIFTLLNSAPQSRKLAGVILESLVHGFLADPGTPISGQFYEMRDVSRHERQGNNRSRPYDSPTRGGQVKKERQKENTIPFRRSSKTVVLQNDALLRRRRETYLLNLSQAAIPFPLNLENYLFIPLSPSNPLFDSFFIIKEDDSSGSKKRSWRVTLFVFQVTLSAEHGGSSNGYSIIDRIKAAVRERLGGTTSIEVCYCLVGIDDHLQQIWRLPHKGWEAHRGDVLCLLLKAEEGILFFLREYLWKTEGQVEQFNPLEKEEM